MRHVVLLGDSIFDNGTYVPGEDAVIDQLRAELPNDWEATLLARDGDVVADVATQLMELPDSATDLVVSVGGNDALGQRRRRGRCRLRALHQHHGWVVGEPRLSDGNVVYQQRRCLQRLRSLQKYLFCHLANTKVDGLYSNLPTRQNPQRRPLLLLERIRSNVMPLRIPRQRYPQHARSRYQ